MYRDCLARIGSEYQLSKSADLIPDHVELDVKKKFDSEFKEVLFQNSSMLAEKEKKEMLDWFGEKLKIYVPNNPLEALRPVLISLCTTLSKNQNENTKNNLINIADKLKNKI